MNAKNAYKQAYSLQRQYHRDCQGVSAIGVGMHARTAAARSNRTMSSAVSPPCKRRSAPKHWQVLQMQHLKACIAARQAGTTDRLQGA